MQNTVVINANFLLVLKTGTVSQAAGSGYLEIGDSKVLVAMYGILQLVYLFAF